MPKVKQKFKLKKNHFFQIYFTTFFTFEMPYAMPKGEL